MQFNPVRTEPANSKIEFCSSTSTFFTSVEQEGLIGYIQNLSPLKCNRNSTLDYVSFTLQTASGNREAFLYSSPKRLCGYASYRHLAKTAEVIISMTVAVRPIARLFTRQLYSVIQYGAFLVSNFKPLFQSCKLSFQICK